jgi:hypothetical protein
LLDSDASRTRDRRWSGPGPPPALLRCCAVKKLIVLLAVLGIAFIAAKKIRST